MTAQASLTLVGCGIKFLAQLTHEAEAYIKQSDIVLYLVNDPVMKTWIEENTKYAESLDQLYSSSPNRQECYQRISEYILNTLTSGKHVCVVFYGHPCHFSQPGLHAVIKAEKLGYQARILPGISAEDCLIADLKLDTGTCGLQSYEATDFLLYQRKFDPTSHLLLWQVDVIGNLTHHTNSSNTVGAEYLVNYLTQNYAPNHEVVLYEAARYPGFDATINKVKLTNFPAAELTPRTTMYIPPSHQATFHKKIAITLGMKIAS